MSQPNEVIASLSWDCKTCERNGVLHLGVVPDVLGVWGRIKRMHEEASPTCVGAPNYVQIDVPEGAEINDPRVRENPFVVKPSSGMGAAMLAIAASTIGGTDALPIPGHPSRGLPASRQMRAERQAERDARRDRLVAMAEAKRLRKAERRVGGAR